MVGFRCIPMDTASAIRFRHTGRDDAGNSLHCKIADHPAPCRHCLADAEIGMTVLLGSYHFGRPHGVYWTPSPIFLHAEPCERFEQADFVPEIVRHRLVSVRAYDAEDMCIYELGDVCDGTDVERLLDRALSDRRTVTSISIRRDRAVFCAGLSGPEGTPTQTFAIARRFRRISGLSHSVIRIPRDDT
jgi:hypothetical protein